MALVLTPRGQIGEGGFEHSGGGLVEPVFRAAAEVMCEHLRELGVTEMDVGGFKAHGVEQAAFIPLVRERG